MKNNFTKKIIPLILATLFISSCQRSETQTVKNETSSQKFKTIMASEVSRLETGVTVQFPAILQKGSEKDCIEIFDEVEFKKYNGDGKWSVPSRFASVASSTNFEAGKKVLVRGKMTLVKDVSDTSKTCGIVTGQIFEIAEIQNFK